MKSQELFATRLSPEVDLKIVEYDSLVCELIGVWSLRFGRACNDALVFLDQYPPSVLRSYYSTILLNFRRRVVMYSAVEVLLARLWELMGGKNSEPLLARC